ncbi:MAG: acetyl esterase/lipase [Saprospiraceae bacterium]|jgi:acetyl esterase/lipase
MKKMLIILFTLLSIIGCDSDSTDQERPVKAPKGYLNETMLKMAYGLGMLALIDDEPAVPANIIAIKNVTYKTIDSGDLQLDIYKRKDLESPAPTMIFIHGGAWKKGKREDYLPYLIDYAKKGYVTVTISYRFSNVAKFPAAAQDVSCAIKWVKSNAPEYGIDPDRIAVVGGSAGGHLALLIGYGGDEPVFNQDCESEVSSDVKVIVDFYGPVDMTTSYAVGTEEVLSFMGTTYEKNPALYKLSSPSTFISSDDPPTLIFQGTIDALVPVSQSDSLNSWLQQVGVPHDYHRLKGWPHTMDAAKEVNDYCQFYVDAFLKKHL